MKRMTENVAIAVIAVAALAFLYGIWWLWWRLPKRQTDRLALTIRDPKARADIEDNIRKTVGQALAGAAVLIGAGSALFQFLQQQQTTQSQFLQQQKAAQEQQQTAQKQFSEQQRATHDLLISNQVSKGFEQLASKEPVMRLGGIYALEGVMNTSDQYRLPVLEALCAIVRDKHNQDDRGLRERTATDIQAALTVIGRRTKGPGVVNLAKAGISGAYLDDANLSGADLTGATNLTQTQLDEACGHANTELPEGLTLKPCSTDR
jgi:hypothetical protein